MEKFTAHSLALVYQAGIANVFSCDVLATTPGKRNAKRLLQHAFVACEWFARGAQAAGAIVAVYSCNKAGDIADLEWTRGMDDCPFRESAHPNPAWL